METVWLVSFLVLLAMSLAANVLLAWRYESLVRRFTSPTPPSYFAEKLAEALKDGDVKGAEQLARVAEVELSYAPPASDADEYIETDLSLTP